MLTILPGCCFLITLKEATGKIEKRVEKYQVDTISYRDVTYVEIIRALLLHEKIFTEKTSTLSCKIRIG